MAGMKVLSLFSGVGGFDMGLEAAGMTTVFQCEIDTHCQQTLRHHWPDVPKWDDVSTLTGAHVLAMTGGVDVVAWGSPCQDLSVAGKRAGLAGARSGLFHQGIRIIKELRELSNGTCPTWSIWENVAGALSSNGGADFGEVLWEMDEAGACFSEWAVLDAQFFGVPQRRRRVFVISCFDSATASRCPEPLLALGESRARDSAPRKSAGQGSAGEVAEGVGGGGRTVQDVVGSLSPGAHPGGLNGQDAYTGQLVVESVDFRNGTTDATVSGTLQAKSNGGHSLNFMPGVLQGEPILMRQREGKPGGGKGPLLSEGTSLTLAGANDQVLFSFDTQFGANANVFTDMSPTLKSSQQSPSVADTMQVRRLTPIECERLMGWPDDHTLPRADCKPNSDTTRYKMCGNGVASPVAEWIGRQIIAATE